MLSCILDGDASSSSCRNALLLVVGYAYASFSSQYGACSWIWGCFLLVDFSLVVFFSFFFFSFMIEKFQLQSLSFWFLIFILIFLKKNLFILNLILNFKFLCCFLTWSFFFEFLIFFSWSSCHSSDGFNFIIQFKFVLILYFF